MSDGNSKACWLAIALAVATPAVSPRLFRRVDRMVPMTRGEDTTNRMVIHRRPCLSGDRRPELLYLTMAVAAWESLHRPQYRTGERPHSCATWTVLMAESTVGLASSRRVLQHEIGQPHAAVLLPRRRRAQDARYHGTSPVEGR